MHENLVIADSHVELKRAQKLIYFLSFMFIPGGRK